MSTRKGYQLERMINIAVSKHAGQFDKQGQPYILHTLTVMTYLQTTDEELQCIAVGHDLIEDCFKTVEEGVEFLKYFGFSERIVNGILAMTKRPGQSFSDYKLQVKSNKDAILVKMADLRHNTDVRRLKGISDKDFERLQRYANFYAELKEYVETTR